MEKVGSLVERARDLTLQQMKEHHVDKFHETVDSYIQDIYRAICASEASKNEFLKSVCNEIGPNGQPVAAVLASLEAFQAYMKDPTSCAQAPLEQLDLSAPISDYYVSSSHNTYLTGNQLYSDAAASAYTSVLLRGCRSVEIDVWDGEPKDPDSSDSETSSDSSSDSDAENDGSSDTKTNEKTKSRTEDMKQKSKDLSRSVSTRLSDALRRKSPAKPESAPAEAVAPAKVTANDGKAVRNRALVEPRVLHGHTLTKETSFREICYAIRDSAFVTSNLPVIVSFEVHCCLEQQQIMVDIMRDAWKGSLVEVSPDLADDKLPKLADLKRKILIKTKSLPLAPSEEEPETPEAITSEEPVPKLKEDQQQKPAKPTKVLEALANMAIYTRAFHFNHFDQPEAKLPGHVFSLSERACRDAHVNHRDRLFEHNRSSFMRIYPFAFRVNSSNLDPAFCWRRGAQLVALNWQNLDKGMMLNHGMFTGTPGWVLKPDGYRSSEPETESIHPRTISLVLEIFAAQNLSLPLGEHKEKGFKPYVNCQLHVEEPDGPVAAGRDDASSDSEKSSFRRCTKSSSGVNPDFRGQKLVFPAVTGVVEELSFVRRAAPFRFSTLINLDEERFAYANPHLFAYRFKIKDDEIGRDSLAAWACIRLDRLREGYRFVHLYDCTGDKNGGLLLVRVVKQAT
ncbi:1-phosphatidylinositol 4,5-bisphosphate phosphodiesterase 1 [Penicillium rolfsii]|nr:1-phosphatidylinositol 4,5-bisphosphate phosphodiesterase 1 [Penicillium rolfsii]